MTAKNPQSNGIIERVHQTISLILRVLIDQRKPDTQEACQRLVEDGLSTAMHATRAAAHSSLEYCTPGSLAFGRDMALNIPYQADLLLLQEKRQQKIDQRLLHANAKRQYFDYQPGMKVYLLTDRKSKLQPVHKGPYDIVNTHANGTVTIQLNDHMTDRVNIRNIKPE